MENQFNDVSFLITGGAGFVGSNLVKMLLGKNEHIKITVIDNLLSSEKFNLFPNARLNFIEGSITDDQILERIDDNYHYAFHLATYHGNQSSIANPLADHENNTFTTLKLYEKLKNFKKLRKIVYSSAGCSVAAKTFETAEATKEESPIGIQQDSPYSISKIIGEFYSVYYHNQHRLPTVRVRFQNVYGPGEILGAGQWRGTPATVWRNVIPTFIYKAIKKQALPLENNGVASRDFIFVQDICRGLIAAAINGTPGDVYNLASGQETTIAQLANIINDLTKNPGGIISLPKRTWDNSGKRFGNPEKSKKELYFAAHTTLAEGLKETIDWTIQNMIMIEKCIDKHGSKMSRLARL